MATSKSFLSPRTGERGRHPGSVCCRGDHSASPLVDPPNNSQKYVLPSSFDDWRNQGPDAVGACPASHSPV